VIGGEEAHETAAALVSPDADFKVRGVPGGISLVLKSAILDRTDGTFDNILRPQLAESRHHGSARESSPQTHSGGQHT